MYVVINDTGWRRAALVAAALVLAAPSWAVDKNGVSPNVINVPNGPGSIEGMGQTFEPQLNTGSAEYSLPLTVNIGTKGFQPDLSLAYSSGGGNGPLGYGWSMSLPCVERRTDVGVPRYVDGPNSRDDDGDGLIDEPDEGPVDRPTDEVDKFITEGGETLVAMPDGNFFVRFESGFVRYRHVGDHWEATDPTGVRMIFGETEEGRVSDLDTGRVARWCVQRMIDTNGNTIVFRYREFPGDANLNQRYLSEISYGPGAPPWTAFHYIVFRYEPRPDWFEECNFGFRLHTGMRMVEVLLGTQGVDMEGRVTGDLNNDGIIDALTRRYSLQYATHPHWSLLSSLQVFGADGVTALPPARLTYTVCDPPSTVNAGNRFIGGTNEPNSVMDNPLVEFIDLNGDALPDILRTELAGGAHSAYLNRGEETTGEGSAIRWEGPVEVSSADGLAWAADLSAESPVTRLADMDGDGLADLVMSTPLPAATVVYFSNTGGVRWGPRQEMVLSGDPPPSPFSQDDVRQDDIDGNNKIDIIQSISVGGGADYRVWFNLGEGVFSERRTISQDEGIPFDLENTDLTDFNGDGIPDIFRIQPLAITVLPGMGHGNFAPAVTVSIPDGPLDELLLQRTSLHDITGDGLPELVVERPSPGTLWYWVNLGTYRFEERREVNGLPTTIGEGATIRWADINGNGTEDLIYADRFTEPRLQSIEIGRLLGCVPSPNLLVGIDNGIGMHNTVEYSRSTAYAIQDFNAGRPWPDIMPNPIEVVSRTLSSDGLGHTYEKRFQYHDGYYDPKFRAFRGFSTVEQIEVGDESAPTGVVRFEFDTGRTDLARKGKLIRESRETENGEVFEQVTTDWETRLLYLGVDDRPVEFARALRTVRDISERGAGTPRRLEMEYEHDNFGNVTREANYGVVEPGNPGAFADEQIKLTEYAIDLDRWMLRYPTREVLQDLAGNAGARTESYYDDPTFSAGNAGQISRGNLSLKKAWHDPSRADGFVLLNRFHYDAFGNPVVALTPRALAPGGVVDYAHGSVRDIEYDSLLHILPVKETIYLGNDRPPLVQQAEYDLALGVMRRTLDFPNQPITFKHDVFARLISFYIQGEVPEFPTEEYDYVLGQPLGDGRVINYVERRWVDKSNDFEAPLRGHYHVSRVFSDGLGREVLRKEEAEQDAEGNARVSVFGATVFNARQTAAGTLQPFYTLLPGDLDAKLEFESIEAPGWRGQFHLDGELLVQDLASAPRNSMRYDATLREVENIAVDGAVHRNVYEPLSELVFDENDTDPSSSSFDTPTRVSKDGLDRVISIEEQVRMLTNGAPSDTKAAWTTRYGYDLNNKLSRVEDAQGNVRILRQDGLLRTVYTNDPDRGERSYGYDEASNLTSFIDAKGQETRYTYDGSNRIVSIDYLDEGLPFSTNESPDVLYEYDEPTGVVDIGSEDAVAEYTQGRLVHVHDTAGDFFVSYDIAGGTSWLVRRIRDQHTSTVESFTSWTAWDTIGRLVGYQFPDGDTIELFYNDLGVTESITGGETIHPDGNPFVLANTEQTPSGRQLYMDFGNGIRNSYEYDLRGRMHKMRSTSSGGAHLLDYEYSFDPMNNVRAIRDLRPAAALPEGNPRRNTQQFGYDDAYRLIRAEYHDTVPGELSPSPGFVEYRYSPAGNMLSQQSNIAAFREGRPLLNLGLMHYGGAAGQDNRIGRTIPDPGPHALTATQSGGVIEYDANGNVTRIDSLQLTWDFEDRLAAIESPTVRAEYQYDYTDTRKSKRIWRRASSADPWPVRPSEVALYPTTTFEVREGGQSFKHIFQNKTRIARIAGTLNPESERLQRFQLFPGWNLIALSVDTADAAEQLGLFTDANFSAVFRWDADTGTTTRMLGGEALPVRTVLWVNVAAAANLSLRGAFDPAAAQSLPDGQGYLAAPDLSGTTLRDFLPASTTNYQFYDAAAQRWVQGFVGDLDGLSGENLPPRLVAGQAVFVRTSGPVTVEPPTGETGIQYYHLDPVASSNLVTDASGAILFETAYYPYGEPRNEFEPDTSEDEIPNHYMFASKERDKESGLQYFEARYLAGNYGRFLSVDPIIDELPEESLLSPQSLHPYAYSRNNPMAFGDPTGKKPVILFRKDDEDKKVKQQVFSKYWGWTPVRAVDPTGFEKKVFFDKLSPTLKVMLHSMAREEEGDPGMYLKFRSGMKGLGLSPEAIKMTDARGVILRSGLGKGGQGYVSEKKLMEAAEREFNLRASIWLSKKLQRFAKPENRIDIDAAVGILKQTNETLDYKKFGEGMKEMVKLNEAGNVARERRGKGGKDQGTQLP